MAVSGISFKISVDTSEVSRSIKGAVTDVKGMTSSFDGVKKSSPFKALGTAAAGFAKSLAKGATVGLGFKAVSGAVNLVSSSVSGAISRIDTLNNSNKVFQNMSFSAKDTEKMMSALNKSITGLPTTLDSAVQGVQMLAASTGDIGKSEKVFSAINNSVIGFGGTADMVNNAIMQLSQLPMDGPLDAETWNSLRNSGLTPVLNAIAKESGMSMNELKTAFGSGQLTVEDFQDAMIKLNEKGGGGLASLQNIAKDATAGISTSISIMKTAVVRGVAAVIDGFDNFLKQVTGMGLADIFSGIGKGMETGLKAVVPLLDGLVPIAKTAFTAFKDGFNAVLNFIQPLITKIGEFVTAFSKTSEASTIFSSVVEGIKCYMGMLVDYWTGIFSGDNSVFNSFTRIFAAIKTIAVPILQDAISFIQGIISQLTAFWDENGQQIIAAVQTVFSMVASIIEFVMPAVQSIIESVWGNIKGVIQGALDVILGLVKIFASVFTGDWSGLWEGIKQLFSGAVNFLWNLWNLLAMGKILGGIKSFVSAGITSIKNLCTNMINAFKGALTTTGNIWNAIKTAVSTAINGAKSIVSSVVNSVKSTVSSVWNGIKSTTSSVWNGIKSAMTSPITAAKNTIAGIINRVKSLFNFKLKFPSVSIPHIPLPHFSISGSFNPLKGQLPKIGIDWYQTGGIFTGASVIGVGENGDEAVVPLSNKSRMAPFAKAVSDMMKDEDSGGGVGGLSSGVLQPVQLTYIAQLDKKVLFKDNVDYMIEVTQQAQRSRARRQGKRTF